MSLTRRRGYVNRKNAGGYIIRRMIYIKIGLIREARGNPLDRSYPTLYRTLWHRSEASVCWTRATGIGAIVILVFPDHDPRVHRSRSAEHCYELFVYRRWIIGGWMRGDLHIRDRRSTGWESTNAGKMVDRSCDRLPRICSSIDGEQPAIPRRFN